MLVVAASLSMLLLAAVTDDAVAQNEQSRGARKPREPSDRAPIRRGSAARGLHFSHRNGMTGALYMPETVGAGGALLDYDGDGDLDVYLAQGGDLHAGQRRRRRRRSIPQSAAREAALASST